MKNKLFILFALFALIICNGLLMYQLLSERQQRISLSNLIIAESLLREQLLYTLSMDQSEVDLTVLSEKGRPIFCYYASDIHCHSCVDSLFTTLCELGEESNVLPIALLAKYKNKNHLNLFLRQHSFNGVVLDINKHDDPMFNSETPLMFVYHPNEHRISDVLRPVVGDMATTRTYLNLVLNKYSVVIRDKNANI